MAPGEMPVFLLVLAAFIAMACGQLLQASGTLRVYSNSATCSSLVETNAMYPDGQKQRHTTTSHHCLRCTSCDPNRKREICISDYCIHLGDTAVFIFSDNGTLRKTVPLTCSHGYLHPSTVSNNLIFIVCEGQSQYLELDDFQISPMTVQGGSLIFANGHDANSYPSDFILYLRSNQINLEVYQDRSALPRPLRSPPECDTLMKLHPRAARGNEIQFLLDCTTESNITKRFNMIENRYEGSSTFTEIHDATCIPIDSPNGSYIAIIHNDSLTIYNASDLQQYPGTKTFAGHIWGIDFLSSSQLLVVVPGRNHTLVDIPVFVQSEGLRGVAELPSTIAHCPTGGTCLPHKLINRDTLLVFTRNGNFYDAQFYTTTFPIQRLGAVQRIRERPQVAFYNTHAANPLPPPLTITLPTTTLPTSTLPTSTLPTTTRAAITSSSYGTSPSSDPTPTTPQTSSANQVEPSPTQLSPLPTSDFLPPSSVSSSSSLPLDPTPTGSGSQQMTPTALAVSIAAPIVFAIIVIFIFVASTFFIRKRKEHAHYLHRCPRTMVPTQVAPINQPRHIVGAENLVIVTSPPNTNDNGIQLGILPEPPSSGYSSLVPSSCPTPTARLSNASVDDELSHLRDQATPPDGSSQNGDVNTRPAPFTLTVPGMHRTELVV